MAAPLRTVRALARALSLSIGVAVGVAWFDAEARSTDGAASTQVPTRLYAKGYKAWIYAATQRSQQPLGYLRAGQSVKLAGSEPVSRTGCADGWYEVEPYGFVCHDRHTAFAPNRYVRSMQAAAASDRPLPFRYALSNGAPMYRKLPTPEQWQTEERFLGAPGSFKPLSWGNRGHEALAEVRTIAPSGEVPAFFADGGSVSRKDESRLVRRSLPLGSMLAYTSSFEHAGRTWLFSADGTVVPADRVRPFRESTFQGRRLDAGFNLPVAWIRGESRSRWARQGEALAPHGAGWPLRSAVALDDAADGALDGKVEPITSGGKRYLPTLERDENGRQLFILETDATLVERRDRLPWGASDDDKWIWFSITRGVLVAYEGKRPVFTTLASPGAGGVPVKGRDPVKWSTTPLGTYRITFKHKAADMSPEQGEHRSFWIADVPYTLYFDPPFAVHVAYWHENFGEPMSAGCINVSPRDGKWLFGWTDPPLPPGWNGVGPTKLNGKSSFVVVVR